MSEMVERAAAALEANYHAGDPDRIWSDSRDGNMKPLVRFVIAAMREPTEAMLAELNWHAQGTGIHADGWRAAIDEALKP